jgi:predicted PurR-regulated permease PerM
MGFERQVMFWVGALAVVVGGIWLLADILLPFIAGMGLAYLLDPVARAAGRFGVGRAVAALIIVAVVIIVLVVVAMLVVPVLGDQFTALLNKLPGYLERLQSLIADPSRPWLSKMVGERLSDSGKSLGGLAGQASGWFAAVAASLWSGGRALFSVVSLLVVTPVVAFYLLCDWDRLIAAVDGWLPVPHRNTIRGLAREIDSAIAAFVRGQAVICVVLAAFYAVGLTLVGLNFGFLIGLVTGLISFVPFVGALTGFLVACIVAIAQFWPNLTPISMVIGVFAVGQGLEGYVLSPKLVGAKIGLHPVWLIFALFAFSYLFGFLGLLVAIPLAAAVGVLVRFALRQYMASSIYTGDGAR